MQWSQKNCKSTWQQKNKPTTVSWRIRTGAKTVRDQMSCWIAVCWAAVWRRSTVATWWHQMADHYKRELFYVKVLFYVSVPSVLWCCWLAGRKGIQPVKNWVVGCWGGYLSGARCRLAYGPADSTATHCLLLQWNPDWFYTFLVPAYWTKCR